MESYRLRAAVGTRVLIALLLFAALIGCGASPVTPRATPAGPVTTPAGTVEAPAPATAAGVGLPASPAATVVPASAAIRPSTTVPATMATPSPTARPAAAATSAPTTAAAPPPTWTTAPSPLAMVALPTATKAAPPPTATLAPPSTPRPATTQTPPAGANRRHGFILKMTENTTVGDPSVLDRLPIAKDDPYFRIGSPFHGTSSGTSRNVFLEFPRPSSYNNLLAVWNYTVTYFNLDTDHFGAPCNHPPTSKTGTQTMTPGPNGARLGNWIEYETVGNTIELRSRILAPVYYGIVSLNIGNPSPLAGCRPWSNHQSDPWLTEQPPLPVALEAKDGATKTFTLNRTFYKTVLTYTLQEAWSN